MQRPFRNPQPYPILARYTFGDSGSVLPFVTAGPSVGFLRKAVWVEEGEPDEDDEQAKSFDFGLNVGAGVTVPQGNRSIFGELRYVHGFANVVDAGSFELRHRGVQVLGGVTFQVGRNN